MRVKNSILKHLDLKVNHMNGYSVVCGLLLMAHTIFLSQSLMAYTGKQQNVILIFVDDLNEYGDNTAEFPDIKTTGIDKLKNIGVNFKRAWPTVSWCNPSRVSILTGIHPFKSGVVSNANYPFRDFVPNATTLIEHFAQNGYTTFGAGKVFHKQENIQETWDQYNYFLNRPQPDSFPGNRLQELIDAMNNPGFDWGAIEGSLEQWGEYNVTTSAVDFLSKEQSKPFFMALGYRLPHLPWYYPKQFEYTGAIKLPKDHNLIGQKLSVAQVIINNANQWENAIRSYLSCIQFVDYNIGLLMDAIAEKQLLDNTIIILVSDNGFHLGEKGRWEKVTLWKEALNTPLIIYAPHLTKKRDDNTPVSLLDIYPTLIDLCKLPSNKFLDGRSIAHLLRDDGIDEKRSFNFSQLNDYTSFSISNDSLKYLKKSGYIEAIFLKEDLFEISPINPSEKERVYYNHLFDSIKSENSPFENMDTPIIGEVKLVNNYLEYNLVLPEKKARYIYEISNNQNFNDSRVIICDENSIKISVCQINPIFIRAKAINPKFESSWTVPYEFSLVTTSIIDNQLNVAINDSFSYYDVDLLSITGQILFTKSNIKYETINFNISDFSRSIYFVRLRSKGSTYIKKVIL